MKTSFLVVVGLISQGSCAIAQPNGIERAGAGSYTTVLPAKAKEPPAEQWKTERVTGPMPTSDWWSSLLWTRFSEPLFAHPLAVRCEAKGLRVSYPGANLSANKVGIMAGMPGKGDFSIGLDSVTAFPDARVDGYSDWFVTARFQQDQSTLRTSFGHGSPYVYATFDGGELQLNFDAPPKIWSGDAGSAVLGISIGNRHYGLFAPTGSQWQGLDTQTWTCRTDKKYFSAAVLPDATPATLQLFARHAHAHVENTQIGWNYDPKTSQVNTSFAFTTRAHEGTEKQTLFALYPHQWTRTQTALQPLEYRSVRGTMKVGAGNSFATQSTFPGILPSLPDTNSYDKALLRQALQAVSEEAIPGQKDTYWDGKYLGRLATLLPIAEQENSPAFKVLMERLKTRLERWFTADKPEAQPVFYWNRQWGTLIGYPASYGSDHELSDHHFHYGYFLQAAAGVARYDTEWAKQWAPMVNLLARDIASSSREDKQFPFLRNFDPYAGHSWASGTGKFGSGNNQESSSEAMNAWTGLIMWGEVMGDAALRDLGIYLYTTEMEAINNYWFNVENQNWPAAYQPSVVTMIWGGKGVNETWFSKNPEAVHGINWLPFHGGSLYLGQYPAYIEKNYAALVQENGGQNWDQWADIIWMYRALANPDDALQQYQAQKSTFKGEDGNSHANLIHWLYNLKQLGQVQRSVSADYPFYAVFQNGAKRTYVVHNMSNQPRTVTFSDGAKIVVAARKGAMLEKGQ